MTLDSLILLYIAGSSVGLAITLLLVALQLRFYLRDKHKKEEEGKRAFDWSDRY